MSGPSPYEITVWLSSGDLVSFFPPENPLAKWIISLPRGAQLVSCPYLGILIRDEGGDLEGAAGILSCARVRELGYDIIDGWDPDHWLERLTG